ncbi:Neprosin activation peptide, partial [Sesbania bispinosa]
MTILVFLMILFIVTNSYGYARLPISRTDDLEEKHLKLINKPPITSIKTKFGDIIDCIDINKQPAFDHPLLKNHKLQSKPSFLPKRTRTNEHNALPIGTVEFELEKDSCPIGSVPIRRTTKDDLIRMKSVPNQTHGLTQGAPGSHFASLYTKQGDNYSYFGVHGYINVYNPRVKKGQTSVAQIGVQRGDELGGINAILFGWQ